MKTLKLTLSGDTAFFKKPDVNTNLFFTFGNIHRPAILGIIGAVLGMEGYSLQDSKEFPDYYSKLKDLEVAIAPNSKGSFSKQIQTYNNATGFFNKSDIGGATAIITEQWLVNPSWDIYINLEHKYGEDIEKAFINEEYVYIPYLGNNTHFAIIDNVEILEAYEVKEYDTIDSFCPVNAITINTEEFITDIPFTIKETLPTAITPISNYYISSKFIYTNQYVISNAPMHKVGNKTIYFIGGVDNE